MEYIIMPVNVQNLLIERTLFWLSILPECEISETLIHVFCYNTFHKRLTLIYLFILINDNYEGKSNTKHFETVSVTWEKMVEFKIRLAI